MNAFSRTVAGIGSGINTSSFLESIFIYLGLLLVSLNPVSAAQISQQLLADHQIVGFWSVTLASDGSTIPIVAPWISFSVFYLVISAVLVVIAVRKMRQLEVED
jgi:hypothetical protein